MRIWKPIFLALALMVSFPLVGCDSVSNWWTGDNEEFNTLRETMTPEEKARLGVFDAAAAYIPIQVVFEQVVTDPTMPRVLRDNIKIIDVQVLAAIKDYRTAVDQFGAASDTTTIKLQLLVAAMSRAQVLLIEAQQAAANSQ